MQALNLAYCELVSLLSLSTRGSSSSAFSTSLASTHDSTSSGAKGKGREKGAISEAAHAMQLKRVGEYVVQTLRGEVSMRGRCHKLHTCKSVAGLLTVCGEMLILFSPCSRTAKHTD